MTIILGYDESPGASRALQVAIEYAATFTEALIIVYGAAVPGGTGEEYLVHDEAIRQNKQEALDQAVQTAEAAGVPATVEILAAKPDQALIAAAERHQARLIIVGSWGDGPIRGALLGSTPHKLLHLSSIPILCVPHGR
ncbi:universal stress protein [Streptomyces sp. NPDC004787]|uniref:universal stress protein n=1 Tax=Streptomyces sp. NPDC004787 TaxID=3154291 RepID=UPI0033A92FFA